MRSTDQLLWENLGCKARVSSGLDWVFEQVPEAIILEDDCLPHPTFFRFCEELLAHYRDDQRVGMISGDNFQFGHRINDDSYYFSNINHIWGWATWRSRWQHDYDVDLKLWPKMLEPWALNHKALKKRIALALFQWRDLVTAHLLVATSSVEYENIRKLGLRMPVAIIPNGVALNAGSLPVQARQAGRSRVALFLSRVHPVKGLLNLVHAWAQLAPVGWRLRIAGPDEAGHLKDVLALVRKLGIQDSVDYVGAIDGVAKSALYNSADVFVLPTFTENFGLVVAKALTHGLPVITTRGAPWADLTTYDCGWWVDVGVDPLVHALREAMALSDDERQAMGARGREYVQRYNWDDIAQHTIEVYRWVLGEGPQPNCVRTD